MKNGEWQVGSREWGKKMKNEERKVKNGRMCLAMYCPFPRENGSFAKERMTITIVNI